MRILIYGAGAVGCYIGANLALGGHTVTLLGRESLVKAVEQNGLILATAARQQQIGNIRVVSSLEDALAGEAPFDWIAFTMKAYDTAPSVFELQGKLPAPPPIACFQNGVGNEDSLAAAFGPEQIVAGTLTTPVSLQGSTVTEEKRRGLAIAGGSPAAAKVAQALMDAPLEIAVVDNADSLKWSKLLLNMIGNATSAILDMPPGEVFKNPALYRIEIKALREALAIIKLKEIEVINLPGSPAKLLARAVKWLPPVILQPILTRQVAGGRGDKLPSLLVTLRSGRKQTEAPWLNGAVAQAAQSIRRLAPVNHVLALLVSDIATGRAPWEMYRHRPDLLVASIRAAEGMYSPK